MKDRRIWALVSVKPSCELPSQSGLQAAGRIRGQHHTSLLIEVTVAPSETITAVFARISTTAQMTTAEIMTETPQDLTKRIESSNGIHVPIRKVP